jgi:hypothetical protein
LNIQSHIIHPTFLIVGPPKCASTSLHYFMGQHPDIFTTRIKEPHFFNDHYEKGIEFYAHYFKEAKNVSASCEATPTYAFLPFVADRIKRHFPDIKLIFTFRNPVERAFSNWLMLWDAGIEKADFREAIEINLRQLKYISWEGEDAAKQWISRPHSIARGEKWLRTYVEGSMYAQMMRQYRRRFSNEQIKYIFLEDLQHNFDNTLSDLFHFVGVSTDFKISNKNEQNFYYDRKYYRLLIKIVGIHKARQLAKRLPKGIKNVFKQKKGQVKIKPALKIEDRQYMYNIFKSDIEDLEKLTARDLTNWKVNDAVAADTKTNISNERGF